MITMIEEFDDIPSKEEAFEQFKQQWNLNNDQSKQMALTPISQCQAVPTDCNPEAKSEMNQLFAKYKSQIPLFHRAAYKI